MCDIGADIECRTWLSLVRYLQERREESVFRALDGFSKKVGLGGESGNKADSPLGRAYGPRIDLLRAIPRVLRVLNDGRCGVGCGEPDRAALLDKSPSRCALPSAGVSSPLLSRFLKTEFGSILVPRRDIRDCLLLPEALLLRVTDPAGAGNSSKEPSGTHEEALLRDSCRLLSGERAQEGTCVLFLILSRVEVGGVGKPLLLLLLLLLVLPRLP